VVLVVLVVLERGSRALGCGVRPRGVDQQDLGAEAKQQHGTNVSYVEVWSEEREKRGLTTLRSTLYIHAAAGRMAGTHVLSDGR